MPDCVTRAAVRRAPLALALVSALAVPLPVFAQPVPPGLRAQADARIFPRWATPSDETNPLQKLAPAPQPRVVSSCADAGPGSLRNILADAVDGDTLDLSGLHCSRIDLQTGVLEVRADTIHLHGPGADKLVIDGGGTDRVLIDPYSILTISGLAIRNGANRTSGFKVAGGGCIAAAGELVLIDSVVSGCLAAGEGAYGGALYAFALTMRTSTVSGSTAYGVLPGTGTAANGGAAFVYRVDLVDSTISGNTASHQSDPPRSSYDVGGGIMIVRGGRISGSTFADNQAGDRGGAINSLDSVLIANSTFADNTVVHGRGGAIYMRAPASLTLNNATISGNRGGEGGGLHLSSGGANIHSSIIEGNLASLVPGSSNLSASEPLALTGDHNLIGAGHGTVLVPADTLGMDARLLPLGSNGGPTRTMALALGSPAVDAGSNPLALAFDQRGAGHPRIMGATVDVGAFEGVLIPHVAVPGLSTWLASWLSLLLVCCGTLFDPRRARLAGHGKT